MASTAVELLRRRFGGKKESKQYVDIYRNCFPVNGIVTGRANLYAYTKSSMPSGSKIHLAFDVSNVPATVTYIHIGQTTTDAAANRVGTFSPPFNHIDLEFTTTRSITFVGIFFSEQVDNVPITNIVLEEIITT